MANQVTTNNTATMSSREIAELTDKKHAHVCRDIRNMLAQLGVGESKFGSVYLDSKGEKRTEYLLPRRECEILVCGYDIVRRSAVIDRWLELETKQRQAPTSLTYAQLLVEIAKQNVAQEAALMRLGQAQEEQNQRLTEVEHKITSRGCKVGYLLIGSAKRRYASRLSRNMFRTVIEHYCVPKESIFIDSRNGPVMTIQVEEATLASVIEEFYSGLVKVTPQRYAHPDFGPLRFKA